MGTQTGKRYVCAKCGSEFVAIKGGDGTLTCHGEPMKVKQ